MRLIFAESFENHHVLEIEDKIRTFIKRRKNGQGGLEFERSLASVNVSLCGSVAKRRKVQNLLWKNTTNSGDRTRRPTIDESVKHARINTNHQ